MTQKKKRKDLREERDYPVRPVPPAKAHNDLSRDENPFMVRNTQFPCGYS